MKIPFDIYDFFGYLASGFVLLIGMELVFGFPSILGGDSTVAQGALVLLGCYIAGHALATPASALLETLVVYRLLGSPSDHLLYPKSGKLRFLFPGYYRPLPQEIRRAILDQASDTSGECTPRAIFFRARFSPTVQNSKEAMDRLGKFLAQYGFARNMTFTLLLVGGALLSKGALQDNSSLLRNGIFSIVAALAMFYRYLKFYRQYAYETLLTYCDLAATATRSDQDAHSSTP